MKETTWRTKTNRRDNNQKQREKENYKSLSRKQFCKKKIEAKSTETREILEREHFGIQVYGERERSVFVSLLQFWIILRRTQGKRRDNFAILLK